MGLRNWSDMGFPFESFRERILPVTQDKHSGESEQMPRPRHLPAFNPRVPKVLSRYPSIPDLSERAQKCVWSSLKKKHNAGFLWLALYRLAVRKITALRSKEQGTPFTAQLSHQEQQALLWLYHRGKWNWSTKAHVNRQEVREESQPAVPLLSGNHSGPSAPPNQILPTTRRRKDKRELPHAQPQSESMPNVNV